MNGRGFEICRLTGTVIEGGPYANTYLSDRIGEGKKGAEYYAPKQ